MSSVARGLSTHAREMTVLAAAARVGATLWTSRIHWATNGTDAATAPVATAAAVTFGKREIKPFARGRIAGVVMMKTL